jgi:hypothetical protein
MVRADGRTGHALLLQDLLNARAQLLVNGRRISVGVLKRTVRTAVLNAIAAVVVVIVIVVVVLGRRVLLLHAPS